MLSYNTPDEFPEFNGWRPPICRSDIDDFTHDDAFVVLYGDGSGHGGHASDAEVVDKSRFPPGWEECDVTNWVCALVDSPSDGYDDGSGFSLFGSWRGVPGVLRVRPVVGTSRWHIATGHPLYAIDWLRERG